MVSDLLCGCLQAAAAVSVGMGSFSDPYEAQGLAHFLGLRIMLVCGYIVQCNASLECLMFMMECGCPFCRTHAIHG